jgi:hypothetical protein
VFLFFFLTTATLLQAQNSNDCEQTLNQAAQEFTAGHFYGLPALLKPCLDNFSNEQRVRAYMLLAQAYLVIDDPIAAEDSYLKLLRAEPEYIATPEKDPIDIVYLSKKFTTRPIFTPRFKTGANTTFDRVIQAVSTDPMAIKTNHKMGVGLQIGGGLDWNVTDHWSVSFDVLYGTKSFQTTKTGISTFDTQSITESQSWVDIPLYLKYSREIGRVIPYGYLGLSTNILLSASATANFTNSYESGNSLPPVEGNYPLSYKRNALNKSIVLGIGAAFKVKRNFISIDLRYMGGLTNLTKASTNYYENGSTDIATSITTYRSVSDFFRIDNISLSFGYSRPIYNPRRIKVIEAPAFFKKIFNKKTKKSSNK